MRRYHTPTMKILVTGGSGRVGWHVVQELAKAHEVVIFGRRRPEEGPHKAKSAFPFVKGDLLDTAVIAKALQGVQAVAHLGANPWFSPTTFLVNTVGTYNMLEGCREAGIKRFVVAGSDWGAGKSADRMEPPRVVPMTEADPVYPHDHYGLSKNVNEVTCEMYGREYGMKTAVLRLTGVWMPEATDGYAAKGHKGAEASCAQYWWTYVDVRDVARAFRMAIEYPGLPASGAYFIAASDTVIDIPTMQAIRKHMPKVKVRKTIPGFGTTLSLAAAKKAFGWAPIHSWRKG